MRNWIGDTAQNLEAKRRLVRNKVDSTSREITGWFIANTPDSIKNKAPNIERHIYNKFLFYSFVSASAYLAYSFTQNLGIGTKGAFSAPGFVYCATWAVFQGSYACHAQRDLERRVDDRSRTPFFGAMVGYATGLGMLVMHTSFTTLGNALGGVAGSIIGFNISTNKINMVSFIVSNALMATYGCSTVKPFLIEKMGNISDAIMARLPADGGGRGGEGPAQA